MRLPKPFSLLLVLAGISFFNAGAQTKPALSDVEKIKNLQEQANQMAAAFNKDNLEHFVAFSYPKILHAVGGKDAMVKILKDQMDQWKEQGIGIDTVSVGEASKIYKAGSELHALIGQTLVMHVRNGTMTKNSFLLAISPNGGAKWYFLDTAPLNNSNIKKLFPSFNKDLVIPAKQEPVFTPNK